MEEKNKLTPLEMSTGITINNADDCILKFKMTSVAIYCYKNNIPLTDLLSFVPLDTLEEYIDSIESNKDDEKTSEIKEDITLVSFFLECMKADDWNVSVPEKIVSKNIQYFQYFMFVESINRKAREALPGVTIILTEVKKGSAPYDLSSLSFRANQGISMSNSVRGKIIPKHAR